MADPVIMNWLNWVWLVFTTTALVTTVRVSWPYGWRLWRWWQARRRRQLDMAAKWSPYSLTDPESGDSIVGLWLVTADHRCLDDVEIERVPEDDEARRLEVLETATIRAGAANVDRTAAQVKIFRQLWEEYEPEPETKKKDRKGKRS